jgi:hypothetical protein
VPDFTNIFHTLCTKMVSKIQSRHLVLKYNNTPHRYIHTEMEFLDISSLGTTYQYAVKIEQNLKQKTQQFGGTPHNIQERVAPHRTKDRARMDNINTTSSSHKQRRTPERQKKISRSGATSIRSLGITLLTATQRSHWWPK